MKRFWPLSDIAVQRPWYICSMSTLLEQVIDDIRALPREEQDRAANLLLAFLNGPQDDTWRMA